jgi:hypothetical protein
MPSRAELLEYFQKELEKNRYKSQSYGDRLLSPEVRGRQNSISQPGPGVEDLGVGEKLLTGGMALSNLPATGASILIQKLQDHLFPSEPSITDSLLPDPLTGELKPVTKTLSLSTKSPKFRGKMGENLANSPFNSPKLKTAAAFIQTRYPKIWEKLGGNIEETSANLKNLGTHDSQTGKITISPGGRPVEDLVGTLSHELGHAIRENRYKKAPEYVPGSQYRAMSKATGSYELNPEEIAARQAGRTGKLNYADFEQNPRAKDEVLREFLREIQNRRMVQNRFGSPTELLPYQTPWAVPGANESTIKNMGNIGGELWRRLLESQK